MHRPKTTEFQAYLAAMKKISNLGDHYSTRRNSLMDEIPTIDEGSLIIPVLLVVLIIGIAVGAGLALLAVWIVG